MERKKPGRKRARAPKKDSRWGFRGMTVRDWLQLLVVPLALVVIGFWFTNQQDARQRELEEQRAQHLALQAYLDQMGNLLLETNLRESEQGGEARTLARARTLTVLSRLDPSRKTAVMQFLVEAELVGRVDERAPIISLSGANLSEADLGGANLRDADLNDADLSYAYLSEADLRDANLDDADLSNAYLREADLRDANLAGADLSNADLEEANLSNATLGGDLSNVNLYGANLSNVNLRGSFLSGVSLEDANLSNADLFTGPNTTWVEEDLKNGNRSYADFSVDDAAYGLDLEEANLIGADLSNADLRLIKLSNADLSFANLSNADLRGADLSNADLSAIGANLKGANLGGANLSGATVSREEYLELAKSLKGATMPDGQKYEDWRKSKGSEEDAGE